MRKLNIVLLIIFSCSAFSSVGKQNEKLIRKMDILCEALLETTLVSVKANGKRDAARLTSRYLSGSKPNKASPPKGRGFRFRLKGDLM